MYSDNDDIFYEDNEDDSEYNESDECNEIDEYIEEPKSFSEEMGDLFVGALLGGAAVVTAAASKRIADEMEQQAQHEAIIREQQFQREQERQAWKYKHRKILLFLRILIILIILAGAGYYEYQQLEPVGYSESELSGIDFQQAEIMLKRSGFGWIIKKNEADLLYNEKAEENLVESVKVGFLNEFDSETRYPSNLPIIITYHTIQTVSVPFSSKEIKGTNYKVVAQDLENAGFGDIEFRTKAGLVSGLLNEEDELISISVGTKTRFSEGDSFRVDEKIVIEYYSKEK